MKRWWWNKNTGKIIKDMKYVVDLVVIVIV